MISYQTNISIKNEMKNEKGILAFEGDIASIFEIS